MIQDTVSSREQRYQLHTTMRLLSSTLQLLQRLFPGAQLSLFHVTKVEFTGEKVDGNFLCIYRMPVFKEPGKIY